MLRLANSRTNISRVDLGVVEIRVTAIGYIAAMSVA
jgi:hypothetical protein